MKTIIKECKGKTREEKYKEKYKEKTYIKKCSNCKSKFTYQNEDIYSVLGFDESLWEYVDCPVCNYENSFIIKRRYRKR